jgi:hypothetical protein
MSYLDEVELSYLDEFEDIVATDIKELKHAQASYGDSWKRRGGVGAFMMLARKWDRIERQLERDTGDLEKWDIFQQAEADLRPEGILDDIQDLRRYLLLVEAEIIYREWKAEEEK